MKLRSLVSTLALAAVSASATPIGSTVTAVSLLDPGSTITNTASWSGTPQTITAFAYNSSGQNSLFSYVDAYNWAADGNSGTVMLQSTWNLVNGLSHASAEPSEWEYTFKADANGLFELNYLVTITGQNTFGLNGIYLTGDLGYGYFAKGDSGVFSANVLAGTTYTVALRTHANIASSNLSGWDGTLVGLFNFKLTGSASVPDTASTLGLLAVSLAVLAGLRRKLV